MSTFITDLAREAVRKLTPYQSARRIGGNGDVWLNANEYPAAIPFQLSGHNLNRYPASQPPALIKSYAQYSAINPNQILASRGADEGIELLIRTFCTPGQDAVLFCPPTYGMVTVCAETFDIESRIAPLTPDWQLDLDLIAKQLPGCKLLYLCSPNNPTGNILKPDDIENLLHQTAGKQLVIVDEAYIEFCPNASLCCWLARFPHLVILRTLSKAFALAGIRCGFTLANPEVIKLLLKVIAPYPLPAPVAEIATQALYAEGISAMQQRVQQLNQTRCWLQQQLQQFKTITVYDSAANWLLFKAPSADQLFQQLAERGIIVRNQSAQPALNNCLRVTIGTPQQCQVLISALTELLPPEETL